MIESLIGLSLLHLAALASPGPDYLLVSRYALFGGPRLGIMASLGIAIGILAHAGICLTGLSVLFTQWPESLWIIRTLGALYLFTLGARALWHILCTANTGRTGDAHSGQDAPPLPQQHTGTDTPLQAAIFGFMTNLLNPKAIIFFASLFTAFIPTEGRAQFGIIACVSLFVLTFTWFALVSIVLSRPTVQGRAQKHQRKLEMLTGVAFMLMGLTIIVMPLLSPAVA